MLVKRIEEGCAQYHDSGVQARYALAVVASTIPLGIGFVLLSPLWWGHVDRHRESPPSAPALWQGPRWWRTVQALVDDGAVHELHRTKSAPGMRRRPFSLGPSTWLVNMRLVAPSWCVAECREPALSWHSTPSIRSQGHPASTASQCAGGAMGQQSLITCVAGAASMNPPRAGAVAFSAGRHV